ncbi:MAG: peptidoglycan DD-metalloendopeptidase family protein [Candidatus Acidiferrales bacterium]
MEPEIKPVKAMPTALRIGLWLALLVVGAVTIALSFRMRYAAEDQFASEITLANLDARRLQEQIEVFTDKVVPAGHPFNAILQELGLTPDLSSRIVASAQSVFDLRHLRAGNRLSVGRSVLGELREVKYRIDADRMLQIAPAGNDFHAEVQTIPSETQTKGVVGEVHGSLFSAVIDAGEKPELAMRLADIFGWDLDFYTDPRPGDTFRVVVEKKMLANGEMSSYGRILMAEYNNGPRSYRAVLFHDPTGAPAYYTPDGKSMKKAFLHSPLKFQAVITSHFSNSRFHPILKQYRPHLGIDYAAPTGTPVQTIGEGRVIFAGPKGGAGNLIEIQHTNGYTTYYMHLSRILIHSGQHVTQGETIGLVGMTGLATGPHLDFRIQKGKDFVNFERLPLPPSDPISKRDLPAFDQARDSAEALMAPLAKVGTTALASNAAPPPSPVATPFPVPAGTSSSQ